MVDPTTRSLLRQLPGVDRILEQARELPAFQGIPRSVLAAATRQAIDALRAAILDGGSAPEAAQLSAEAVMARVRQAVERILAPRLKRVVNATGIVVHTNLGRSVLAEEALQQILTIAGRYSNLEFDLAAGRRGSRHSVVEEVLREVSGAEAAMVVNNNAGAVFLCLDTLAEGRRVIVSRGELVEIGGSFRIPDVMAKSGGILVEVGTTNRTHLKDYRGAIDDRFKGMDRFQCRKAVVEALRAEGLLQKVEPHPHSVGHCYRCRNIVEPNLSRQWFVRVGPLAGEAIAAVREGRTRIIPDVWENTYYDWMNNIRDWCISRQIWWGHQIPAWTCRSCGEVAVALEAPAACPACGSADLVQETDVLDTWFSSALWPFSTMGWPDRTPLLETFYPTAALVTGFDILFFWVARMMMMGLHFMKDVPFRDVYVHALVRDEEGKKMSKSKGNVIDPLTVIDTYGTDAFRFTLAAFAAQGRDVKMSEKRVEGYRHFINKLWNAARLCLMHLKRAHGPVPAGDLCLPDRWILSRLQDTCRSVTEALDGYRFNDAAGVLYNFVWHEFCDWYLEAIKPVLYGGRENVREATLAVLWRTLRDTLVLLHPFIPFVTEEIWSKLPGTEGSIMRAAYPLDLADAGAAARDPGAEAAMGLAMGVISGIRNIRGEMNIPPSQALAVTLQSPDPDVRGTLDAHRGLITSLARVERLLVEADGDKPKGAATAIVNGASIFVSLEGVIDLRLEAERLEKELGKLGGDMTPLARKLSNEDFLRKAPAEVVEKVRQKHGELLVRQEKLMSTLDKIRALGR